MAKQTKSVKQLLKTKLMAIQFGTSGLRAVVVDEFSFARLRSECSALHLPTDGNADRFRLLNSHGPDTTPNQLIALFFGYLVKSRKWTGRAARSVAISHLARRLAEARSLPGCETPIGFKYIGELINEDEIVICGKESAGPSIKGHYPEKDGILACLLAAEAVTACGASLTEQLMSST